MAITDRDIAEAAKAIGCEEAAVRAVLQVEAAGSGFLADGRPKILFEAHLFGRLTKQRYTGSFPLISSRSWNKALYQGGAREHDRMALAASLDRPAALQSASWGLFQILGMNYKACGFDNVEDFVKAQQESEAAQLRAFVGFIMSNKLDDELRNKNFANFAKQYNGPGYKANAYDTRLMAAYVKASAAAKKTTSAPTERDYWREIQSLLNMQGARLVVDGWAGAKTGEAITAFQRSRELPLTGRMDVATENALRGL